MSRIISIACMLLLPCVFSNLAAQDQSLEQAANDPTASLLTVQLQNLYSGEFHQLDNAHSNTFQLRSAVQIRCIAIWANVS